MKVLLIDDHPLILSALQSVIQGLGDNVVVSTADSGRAAREALRQDATHDLVLTCWPSCAPSTLHCRWW
jgi:DNA-binding NarL/FixJ family response regulator